MKGTDGVSAPLTKGNVMTVEELAEELHVAPRTIYRWANAGTFPSVKLGRRVLFLRSDVDSWLMRRRRGVDDL